MEIKLLYFDEIISVSSFSQYLMKRIKYIFREFIVAEGKPKVYFKISPLDEKENYELVSSNEKFLIEYSYDKKNYLLWEFNDTFLPPVRIKPYENRFLVLHGCAVEKKGKIIAFLAPSMAGKTSLLVYLVENGYKAITDDLLFVDYKDDLKIFPYKKPVGIREGSLEVIPELKKKLDKIMTDETMAFKNYEGKMTWLVHLDDLLERDIYIKEKEKIDFFIKIDSTTEDEFYKMKSLEVYNYLISSICNSGLKKETINSTMIQLLSQTSSYFLSTKNLEFAEKSISSIIE